MEVRLQVLVRPGGKTSGNDLLDGFSIIEIDVVWRGCPVRRILDTRMVIIPYGIHHSRAMTQGEGSAE